VALRQNKLDEAKTDYEAVLKQNPKHLGAMMQLAEIAAKQQKPADVLAWLQKASQLDPKSPAPKLRLIRYYEQTRDVPKALVVARELGTSVPNNPQVLETLGRVEAEGKNMTASAAAFRRLVELTPKSARAHGLFAASQAATNDLAGAKASYQKALELDANYTPSYLALAELAARSGKIDEALKYAATLRGKQPKAAVGDMLTGDVYMRAKKYDEAIAAYDAGLKKEDVGELAIRRYNAERAAGHTDQAFAWLQSWVDRTKQPVVRNLLASNYITAKKYDDAIREFEKLIAAEPKNPIVLNNLAWLYDHKNDKRAVDYAEKAYKEAPKAPAVIDTLGWILVRKGDKSRGLDLLRHAHDLAPNQGDITYHLAAAIKASDGGNKDEAKRLLERALKDNPKFSEADNARKLLKELGG
jgi:putative PEP-CTERM system TPR-repeat lipoprotein